MEWLTVSSDRIIYVFAILATVRHICSSHACLVTDISLTLPAHRVPGSHHRNIQPDPAAHQHAQSSCVRLSSPSSVGHFGCIHSYSLGMQIPHGVHVGEDTGPNVHSDCELGMCVLLYALAARWQQSRLLTRFRSSFSDGHYHHCRCCVQEHDEFDQRLRVRSFHTRFSATFGLHTDDLLAMRSPDSPSRPSC